MRPRDPISVSKTKQITGLTLVEVVLVILLLSIASLTILGLFAEASKGWFVDEDLQVASQLAQERAEQILGTRRNNGYNAIAVGTTNDTLTAAFASYSRTVTVTTVTGAPCPNPSCKQVSISVSRAATSLANITFQLVDY